MRVCTNKNPKGYYFDESDNIYRRCTKPCLDCSGPYISDNQINLCETKKHPTKG